MTHDSALPEDEIVPGENRVEQKEAAMTTNGLLYEKAAYIPGIKNRYAQGTWTAVPLAEGAITWQHTSGEMAGVIRAADGTLSLAARQEGNG